MYQHAAGVAPSAQSPTCDRDTSGLQLMLMLRVHVRVAAASPDQTDRVCWSSPPVVGPDTPAHPPGCAATPLCPRVLLSTDYLSNPYLMDPVLAPPPAPGPCP